ncbi:MAG: 30S ribosomal protein S16 [Gemmatimonadota bacterium]|nr:MAG: 30S ribosomal protein S16 [Gemmatimonadota bacterium]
MATRIRLRRVGRKKQASFRIVVAGSAHARGGRISETIGKYNPRTEPSHIEIDEGRALYWLRQGALVSEGVEPLFRKAGILKKFAEGAAGEGVTVIGDAHGKTIHQPQAGKAKRAAKAEEKPAEAAAEPAPEAAAEAAEPEAAVETAEPETAAEAPEAEAEEEKQEAES